MVEALFITLEKIKAFRVEVTGTEEPPPHERGEWTGSTDIRLAIAALRSIPNNKDVPYDIWRNVGFALHAIDAESEALFAAFDDWSAGYDGHDTAHAEALWEAATEDGGIGPGTLFHHAKWAGWDKAKAQFDIIEADINAEDDPTVDSLKAFYPVVAAVDDNTDRRQLIVMLAKRLIPFLGKCMRVVEGEIRREREKLLRGNSKAGGTDPDRYPAIRLTKMADGYVEHPDPKSQRNIEHLMSMMGISVHRNLFFQETRYESADNLGGMKPLDSDLITRLHDRAYQDDFRAEKFFIGEQLDAIATRDVRDPVRDYLENLQEWDGIPWLATAFQRHLGAPDRPSIREVSSLILRALIRRTFKPGFQFDLMAIFEGAEGLGKSSYYEALMPDPSWFGSGPNINEEAKRMFPLIQGKLIVEFPEMAGKNRTSVEAIKKLITQRTDEFMANYAVKPTRCPRRCVFVGTINERQYLRDLGDNRRFPVIPVTKELKQGTLIAEREQLWAEAKWMEDNLGGELRLSPEATADMRLLQEDRLDLNTETISFMHEIRRFKAGLLYQETIWARLGYPSNERPKRVGHAQHLFKEVQRMMERDGWHWMQQIWHEGRNVRAIYRKNDRETPREIVCNGVTLAYCDGLPTDDDGGRELTSEELAELFA